MYLDLPYAWEGDENVVQQLVFKDEDDFKKFKAIIPHYKNTPKGSSAENGLGVTYKFRAVRNRSGLWLALVRDGMGQLKESLGVYSSPGAALAECYCWLINAR